MRVAKNQPFRKFSAKTDSSTFRLSSELIAETVTVVRILRWSVFIFMGLTTLIHDRLTREFGRNIFFNDLIVVVVKVFPLTTEHFGNQ